MQIVRSLNRLPCLQCVLPDFPVSRMSKWVRRGQCQGRLGRSSSNARRQESPVFQPVSRQWQERQCQKLCLPFVRSLALSRPRPAPLLRDLEPSVVHEIGGDGNCLFRCLSLVITGSESHHNSVRQRIVSHISENCKAFSALLPETSGNENEHAEACARYLSTSKMADGSTWGSDVEILAAAHLLRTRIYVYTLHGPAWQWVEHGMELTEPDRKPYKDSIYLMHTGLVHYDLIEEIEPTQAETGAKDAKQTSTVSSEINCRGTAEKARRRRGYSVPYGRKAQQSGARHRSNSRSSRHSCTTSCSSSNNSMDSYLSCGESVGSSLSRTNVHSASCNRRRRPGVASCNENRGGFPYSNNNCSSKNIGSTTLKTTRAAAANKNDCSRNNRFMKSTQRDPFCGFLFKPTRQHGGVNTSNRDSLVNVPATRNASRCKPDKKVCPAPCFTNSAIDRTNPNTNYKQKRRTSQRPPGII